MSAHGKSRSLIFYYRQQYFRHCPVPNLGQMTTIIRELTSVVVDTFETPQQIHNSYSGKPLGGLKNFFMGAHVPVFIEAHAEIWKDRDDRGKTMFLLKLRKQGQS